MSDSSENSSNDTTGEAVAECERNDGPGLAATRGFNLARGTRASETSGCCASDTVVGRASVERCVFYTVD